MRITVLQESLSLALGIISSAVDPRPLPERAIYGAVHMRAEDGTLTLSASNVEISITTHIGCQVQEAGVIALPARFLQDWIARLPAERVEIEYHVESFTASLRCAGSSCEIKGYNPENFPQIHDTDKVTITIPGGQLAAMIRNVSVAAARTAARPALVGLNLSIEGDVLSVMSGDGFRLSFWQHQLSKTFEKPMSMIVPAMSMAAVRRALAEDEEVSITFLAGKHKNLAFFKGKYTSVIALLIDAVYPNVQPILQTFDDSPTVVTMDRTDLMSACRRIEPFARDMGFAMALEVKAEDGEMNQVRLASLSQERGRGETFVPAHIQGSAVRLSLNVAYTMQALNEIATEQVVIDLPGNMKPAQIRPVQQLDGDDLRHVVMPMNKDPEAGVLPKAKRSVNKAMPIDESEIQPADDGSHLVSVYNQD